jgi:hypothetical protein
MGSSGQKSEVCSGFGGASEGTSPCHRTVILVRVTIRDNTVLMHTGAYGLPWLRVYEFTT